MSEELERLIRERRLNSRDAALARKVSLSPAEIAEDEARDRSPQNLLELSNEILRTKDPKIKRILEGEKQRLLGPRTDLQQGSADIDPQGLGGGAEPELLTFDQVAKTPAGPQAQYNPATGTFAVPKKKEPFKAPEMSFDEVMKGPKVALEDKLNREAAWESGIGAFKNLGGTAMVLADMVLSLPGMAVSVGENLGAQAHALGAGESRKMQAQAGRAAMEHGLGHKLSNPLQKLMEYFKKGDVYAESSGAKSMEKFTSLIEDAGKWVETRTNGAVPGEQVQTLVDTLMLSAGARGSDMAVDWVVKRKQDQLRAQGQATANRKFQEQQVMEARAREELAQTPEGREQLAVQQRINETLGIRSPAEQKVWDRQRKKDVAVAFTKEGPTETLADGREAGQGPTYADNLAFRANESFERSGMWNEQLAKAEQAEIQAAQQAAQLEIRRTNEEQRGRAAYRETLQEPAARQPTLDQVLEATQKAPEARTADDLMNIRAWNRQAGKANPELLIWAGVAGGFGLAGGMVYDMAERSGLSIPEVIKRVMTLQPVPKGKEKLDESEPRPNAEGNFVARSAADWTLDPVTRDLGIGALGGLGAAFGAIKQKGGMWHPEAIERLAEPLGKNVARRSREQVEQVLADQPIKYDPNVLKEVAADKAAFDWANRAIRNYLNKHAGTATDPLKDISIPAADGELALWGQVMDGAISWRAKEDFPLLPEAQSAKSGERIYDAERNNAYTGTIASYLSHVGDYLREHVSPEKLQQYDLTRAVKETAKWDAELAKKMNSVEGRMEGTVPYKEYPDGFKWVEVKEADALKREGDVMGHCVGGYCDYVERGESRIFSLRDKKGMSHVTIEVSPPDVRVPTNSPQHYARVVGGELLNRYHEAMQKESEVKINREIIAMPEFQEWIRRNPEDIIQIKGKQNRAPVAEYLPYVQDFVKGGKWGEVGDLENAGLVDVRKLDPRPYIDARLEAEFGSARLSPATVEKLKERFTGKDYVTKDEWAQAIEHSELKGSHNQEGFVDPRLLAGIAATGLGAIVGSQLSEDPGRGAILGALGAAVLGLPGAKKRIEAVAKVADHGLGVISTRIRNHSEAIKHKAQTFEYDLLVNSYNELLKTSPFLTGLKALPKETLQQLTIDWQNSRAAVTRGIEATGNATFSEAWKQTLKVIDNIGTQTHQIGRFDKLREDHLPRLVIDPKGLFEAIGKEDATRLQHLLNNANEASLKNRGRPLSEVEESTIINTEIQHFARQPTGQQSSFFKNRTIKEVTEQLLPYYATIPESLYGYVRAGVAAIEEANFFGKNAVYKKSPDGGRYLDTGTSIGNVVGEELRAGKIDALQADELISILRSRFEGGERVPHRAIRDIRNVANATLLGNIISALTQLSDATQPLLSFSQGLRSGLTAIAQKVTGRGPIKAHEFALADHVMEELVSASRSGRPMTDTALWVNKVFKHTITPVDRFGKEVTLNAAWDNYKRLAQSEKGVQKIQEKYGDAYGTEFPHLIEDLRAGKRTHNTNLLLFSELADLQPITKLEMSQAYLNNPNVRWAWMLKTFMQKQADIVRRNAYNEMKQGNYGKGLKNLTEYAVVLGLSGATVAMVKDFVMGRPVDFGVGEVAENALKTFGFSEYVREKIAKGEPLGAIGTIILPPWQHMQNIITLKPEAVRAIPWIGPLLYSHEFGGKEKAELAKRKKERAAGRDYELSPGADAFRRKQLEERRLKRLMKEINQ